MSFNVVEIKVRSDYTDHSNALCFAVNVPITSADVDAVNKALASSPWKDVSSAIIKAVNASAPKPIQELVTTMMTAYAGEAPATGGDASKDDSSNDLSKDSGDTGDDTVKTDGS